MRLAALALVGVLAVPAGAASGSASGSAGPFAGTLADGQIAQHTYDNHATSGTCLGTVVRYLVTVRYAPSDDTLTLGVDGFQIMGRNGSASLNFWQGWCTTFPLSVTGTSVRGTAAYVVSVVRSLPGSAQ